MKKTYGEHVAPYFSIQKSFELTINDIKQMIKDFHAEMSKGLAGKKGSLAMIPTFASVPSGDEKGKFIALDLGGTNFRILYVVLKGHGVIDIITEEKFRLQKKDITGEGRRLFDFIANSIKKFMLANKISFGDKIRLGFTFSFPIKQLNISSGILLCWNKGFSAKNVIGEDVVKLLENALRKKKINNIKIASLINDTVGTLAAKRYSDANCDLGVIFGTGTNACYPELISKIKKVPGFKHDSGRMIVNTEWGNFNKLSLTLYDRRIDKTTNNPGRQRLEKMVSGLYLGEIARTILLDLAEKGMLFKNTAYTVLKNKWDFKTEYLSSAEEDNSKNLSKIKTILVEAGISGATLKDRAITKEICGLVLKRSAYISAGAIAAVLLWIDPCLKKIHTVAIDGSLFEKCPCYRRHMGDMLRKIFLKKAKNIKLVLAKDGSSKGAAITAAIAL